MQNVTIATQDVHQKTIREIQKKSIKTISLKINSAIAEEFARLAKQKGFRQNVLIQNAMLIAIEEMKKMEDEK
jgi:hypothetical protein